MANMMQALGMIETKGLVASIEAAESSRSCNPISSAYSAVYL